MKTTSAGSSSKKEHGLIKKGKGKAGGGKGGRGQKGTTKGVTFKAGLIAGKEVRDLCHAYCGLPDNLICHFFRLKQINTRVCQKILS